MTESVPVTVVLGASPNPDRYSYKAVEMLLEHGHTVWPVHPAVKEILGCAVYPDLESLPSGVDTITMYVGPARSEGMADTLLKVGPRRVIFNPGAENPALRQQLAEAGVEVLEACTLVLLRTGAY